MTTTPQVQGAEEGALKSCPACKGAASHLKRSAGMPGTQGFDSWCAVCCIACGLTLGESDRRFRSKGEAAKGWNQRTLPEPAAAPAAGEPIREVLGKLRRELEVTSYHVGKDRLFELVDEAERALAAATPSVPQTHPVDTAMPSLGLHATEGRAETHVSPPTNTSGRADPLYAQACAIVRAQKRGGISTVQRHLRIGYYRAASLLEAMVGDVLAEMPPTTKLLPEKAKPVSQEPTGGGS